jgi:pyruvate,water dikinase
MSLLSRAKELLSFQRKAAQRVPFGVLFGRFQKILEKNNQILELIADMGDKLGGDYVFDQQYIISSCDKAAELVYNIIYNLNTIAPKKYLPLYEIYERIKADIREELAGRLVIPMTDYTMPYRVISRDYSDVVGNKNANLAEVKNLHHLAVPDGFAVTTRAFQSYLEHNQLWDRIETIITAWQEKNEYSAEEAAGRIQDLIMAGKIPPALEKSVRNAMDQLYLSAETVKPSLAIRSSAWGEDSEHTFAGQYTSFLNEPPENILDRYKEVLASAYSSSAMEYRLQAGFSETEVAMAVGCQLLVDAKVSGVLYSLDPQSPEQEVMVITATWGFGAPLVAGKVMADNYTVSREAPHSITALNIVRKSEMLCAKKGGGTEIRPVPEDLQTRPGLTEEQVKILVNMAFTIERYFKRPQDIEWALDQDGTVFILQTRPLKIKVKFDQLVCDISAVLESYPIIFAGKGVIAQRGVGTGKVFVVRSDEDLDDFPQGAILVTKYTSPRLARVIKKANGILTDVGSATGHMATIAREFRVPTIVNTGVATRQLQTGQEITVDAEQNAIYEGTVKELCYYEFTEEAIEETYEYRLLRRVLKKIAPLNLVDPYDKNFNPTSCKTFHDITRFVHEKAVEELIELKYDHRSETALRKLKFPIPLGLVIIDIGGGLVEQADSGEIEQNQVVSVPMRALLDGMAEPGMWATEPMSVDFGSFMSSLTRTFSSAMAGPRYLGLNLAVISKEYINLSLRLGYHFNIIDSYISENPNDNYAYFRFLGGVTDITRRSRRVNFIAEVLGKFDFRVDVRGDLVVARIKKLPAQDMVGKMHILGRLVAFTRQLDVKMISDEHMTKYMEDFLALAEAPNAVGQI